MSPLRHLPNALSILRLLAALPLCVLIVQQSALAAFWLALLAGSCDAVDGWLAKRFGWTSRLGAILDPLADKALLLGALIGLSFTGDVPVALLGLALARDLCLVLGGMVYHWRYEKLTPMPSLPGKLTTLTLVLLVLCALALHAFNWPPRTLLLVLQWLAAGMLVLSWWHYWILWNARSHAVRRSQAEHDEANANAVK